MAPPLSRRGAGGRAVLFAPLFVGFLLLGIGSVQAATVSVAAFNFEFQPASRTVKVGDVVRWTFSGDPHTVTSGMPGAPDGRFDSGIKDPGSSFQVSFEVAGTYRYFCQIHPEQMVGTIVVRAAATPTPTPTPRPTPKPTARPTAAPTASAAPTATRSDAPTTGATPTQSIAPATPSASTASPSVGGSSAPPTTAPPSPGPSAEPDAGEAATDTDPVPIVAGLIALGLALVVGLALARRPRRLD